MRFSWLLLERQCREHPVRVLLLFGGMLCAVCLICGTLIGIESLNESIIVSADSTAARFIRSAARTVTLIIAFLTGLLLKNGFSITLEQQIHILGQLHALGASHRLLKRIVCMEAFAQGAAAFVCGIPLSVFVLQCIFQWLNRFGAVLERFGTLRVQIQPDTVLFCGVCCVFSVLSAIRKPLKIVKSIAPIALMRGLNDAPSHRRMQMWQKGKSFARQYANRNFSQRRDFFKPLTFGVAACTVLVIACCAFTDGTAFIYRQQAATYAYRLYLESMDGDVSDTLWKKLGALSPKTEALLVEETGFRKDGVYFRLLVLEDPVFEAWYGALPPEQGEQLHYVYASAASDAFCETPAIYGVTLEQAACSDKPLPLGIGRVPDEKDIAVGVTDRTHFSIAFPQAAQHRALIVYYDTEDGRMLTPLIQSALGNTAIRYTIQDYTPFSDWARQREAIGILIHTVRICFPAGVLFLGGIEMITTIYAHMLSRRKEFALLRSAGLSHSSLNRIVFKECCLSLKRGLPWGIAGGLSLSVWISHVLHLEWYHSVRWDAILLCPLFFFGISVCTFAAVMRAIGETAIASELRQE